MRTSRQHITASLLLLLQLAPSATSALLLPPFISDRLPSLSKLSPARIDGDTNKFVIQEERKLENSGLQQNGGAGKQRNGGEGAGSRGGRYSYLSATSVPPLPVTVDAIITPSSPSSTPTTTPTSTPEKNTAKPAGMMNIPPPPSVTYVPFSFNPSSPKSNHRSLAKRNPFPQGPSNSGVGNQGVGNSGNYNCGNWNSGNYNNGNSNSGSYNNGNGNSGNGNNGNYQSGNGNNGGTANNAAPCGNVVISSTYAVVYPAPSTIYYSVPAVTTTVIVQQQPQVYVTSCYVVPAAPQTSVVYYSPIVQPINSPNYQYPKGCAYWAAQGYRCSGAGRSFGIVGGVVGAVVAFWGVVGVLL